MPGLTGLELQETLAIAGPRMSIVFVTGHRDVRASVKAMKAGRSIFSPSRWTTRSCFAAIERAVARASASAAGEDAAAEIRERVKTLTARESRGVRPGRDRNAEQADRIELGVSEKMVKVHRGRVMEKMRAGSLAELVRLADEGGVISAKS